MSDLGALRDPREPNDPVPSVAYEARCVLIGTGDCWWRGSARYSEKNARIDFGRHKHPCKIVTMRWDAMAGYWRDEQ